jgi:hypothetical protein
MSNDATGIYAAFTIEPVEMTFLSEQAGRPIFEDREFVRIVIAGDKHSEVYREATEFDKERFHEPYSRFKRGLGEHEQIVGTPLSQWAVMKVSQVKEYNAINIHTVEQLASLSDTMKQKLGMGANEIVAAAKAYLATAQDGAAASHFAAENERLKADIERLNSQMQMLANRLEEQDNHAERRGPGRPPKAA